MAMLPPSNVVYEDGFVTDGKNIRSEEGLEGCTEASRMSLTINGLRLSAIAEDKNIILAKDVIYGADIIRIGNKSVKASPGAPFDITAYRLEASRAKVNDGQ